MGCGKSIPAGATVHPEQQDGADEKDILADLADPDIAALVDEELGNVDAGAVEKLMSLFDSSGKALTNRKVEVQEVRMDQISDVQRKLLKHSALGKVLVEGAGMALSALPFGGVQIASLLSAVYGRTVQTVKNGNNCRKLLKQIQLCDRQLASAIKAVGMRSQQHSKGSKPPALPKDLSDGLHTVGVVVQRAAMFITKYNARGSLLAFITSSSDMATFKVLDAMLRDAMTGASFTMATVALAQMDYVDESAALLKEVCQAARMPVKVGSAEAALKKLQQTDPERLKKLVQDKAPFSTKVLQAQLDALSERVDSLEAIVDGVIVTMAQLKQSSAESSGPSLAPYLQQWWEDRGWRVKKQVASTVFQHKLLCWLQQNRQDVLLAYDEGMVDEGLVINVKVTGQGAQVFLELVVMKLLDQDGDGQVTRHELYRLQVLAHDLAKHPDVLRSPPDSLVALLDVLFLGFDRTLLKQPAAAAPGGGDVSVACHSSSALVEKVQEAMQVAETIQSYKVAELLDEYVQDSRQWMYDKVDAWLDAVAAPKMPTAADKRSSDKQLPAAAARMLLLLADAGMGKSVFSAVMQTKLTVRTNKNRSLVAVHHFFKVGQARASGKAAILCLAHQLADVLDGMAAQLEEVVEVHRDASNLSMADTCDKYLAQPLMALAAPDKPPMPQVLLLLDAMDEADDGAGRGWQPVASLLSRELLKLPSNVHVLVTGRPEVIGKFKAWPDPLTIMPESKDNLEDMKLVVRDRLTRKAVLAAGEDLEAATEVIVNNSKGQFLYIKYVFNFLAFKQSWTVAQLQAPGVLPTGLAGAFQLALGNLQAALYRERPELLHVLRRQMLPVLVVAREPMTVGQLAWLVTGQESQLEELLACASNLFPLRAIGSHSQLRIVPYHKTVLDWLTAEVVRDAATGQQHVAAYNTEQLTWMEPGEVPTAEFRVDPQEGHMLAAAACHAVAMSLPLSDPKTPYVKPQPVDRQLYVLHYSVAHLHGAKDAARLKSLVLHLGFWEWVYAAGFGSSVLQDMLRLVYDAPALAGSEVKDALRWLRNSSQMLSHYPMAVLQLACDAPYNSLISKHALSLSVQPVAQLLAKEGDWGACLAACTGHSFPVTSVAISHDGKTLVSGSSDETIRVWDIHTGERKTTLGGYREYITSVCISPDGKTLVSGSKEKTIRVWDVDTGECRSTLGGHTGDVKTVTISPDGNTIVSGSDDRYIRVWDVGTGKCLNKLPGHTLGVMSVALSPDSKAVASGSYDMTIRVWDLETGACRHTLKGHTSFVASVAISPDGKTLVSGSYDKTIRVWEAETGGWICRAALTGHANVVQCVAISPDGKTMVSGSLDKTVRVWDLGACVCSRTLQGHTHWVECVAISPDGKTLVSGSVDTTIRLWDLDAGGYESKSQGHTDYVTCVAISPDSKILVSGSPDKTIRVWDLDTGECRRTLEGHTSPVTNVDFSPDGKTLVSGSLCQYIRWDLESGAQLLVVGSSEFKALAHTWSDKSAEPARWEGKGRVLSPIGQEQPELGRVFLLPPATLYGKVASAMLQTERLAVADGTRILVYKLL